MILFGSLVQTKGLGFALVSAMKMCMAFLSSWRESKDATLEASLGQESEQTFDGIEPGCRSRGEVEDKTRMVREPFQNLWTFVRGVVVDDEVDCELCRHSGIDDVEEADELLMAPR
jgi:hypothetical protein